MVVSEKGLRLILKSLEYFPLLYTSRRVLEPIVNFSGIL